MVVLVAENRNTVLLLLLLVSRLHDVCETAFRFFVVVGLLLVIIVAVVGGPGSVPDPAHQAGVKDEIPFVGDLLVNRELELRRGSEQGIRDRNRGAGGSASLGVGSGRAGIVAVVFGGGAKDNGARMPLFRGSSAGGDGRRCDWLDGAVENGLLVEHHGVKFVMFF